MNNHILVTDPNTNGSVVQQKKMSGRITGSDIDGAYVKFEMQQPKMLRDYACTQLLDVENTL